MPDVQVTLLPTHYYHIYNHAIGKENFFESDKDYIYFLSKMKIHLPPICHMLTFCLMPNHFHFVVQIKSTAEIEKFLIDRLGEEKFNRKKAANENFLSDQVSQQFSNLFNQYAKHYNRIRDRIGSLFKRAFRRKEITDSEYLKKVICYVHQNPVEAGFVKNMKHWMYSSYQALTDNSKTDLAREEIFELFGGIKNFHAYHTLKSRLD